MSKHLTKPCKECPFARHCTPGATGGAPAVVYVGQAHAPMYLPCHMSAGYAEDRNDFSNPQCAGAAIYRANLDALADWPEHLKRRLHVLPADPTGATGAFRTPEDLLAHHWPAVRGNPELARHFLKEYPPELLARIELGRVLSGVAGKVEAHPTEPGT